MWEGLDEADRAGLEQRLRFGGGRHSFVADESMREAVHELLAAAS
ncbi:hypothetical protein ACFXJM_35730 [Streptomyces massasporeus]